MPWQIKKNGDNYQVVKKSDGKVVGTHPTHKAAIQQIHALHANVKD